MFSVRLSICCFVTMGGLWTTTTATKNVNIYVSVSSSLLNLFLTFRSQMFHLFSFSIFTDMNIGHNTMVPFKWNLLRSNSTMYYNLFSTHGSNFWVSVIQTKPFQHYFHIVPCIINSSFYLVCSFLIPVEKILWHADHLYQSLHNINCYS